MARPAAPVSLASEASVTVLPADGTPAVRPDAHVLVTAERGRLTDVTAAAGAITLAGTLSPDGQRWQSTAALLPRQRYVVSARAVDRHGVTSLRTTSFTTLTPTAMLAARVAPLQGETVGVGMPIVVFFTADVSDRRAVQSRLGVTSTPPVEGAWHWFGAREAHYRPRSYWPAGTKVTLHANIAGVWAGGGVWGGASRTVSFAIGASHVSLVNAQTHTMSVRDNGRVVRTFPVSTGRDQYPTASGVHLVLEKTADKIMDSATVGIPRTSPDGYYEHVAWSTRISYSGEFVHAAPWSVASQGRRNVSHGCVNAGVADAKWFFGFSRRGDVVQVVGTPRRLEPGNGFTDWNMSWAGWLAGDALAAVG